MKLFWRVLHTLSCLTAAFIPIGFSESILIIPHMSHEPSGYTGFALVNPTDQNAEVTLTAYDESGKVIQSAEVRNPSTLSVPARSQVSQLDSEFFGFEDPTPGWILAVSPHNDLVGFFLFGNAQGEFLDGADLPTPRSEIVFPMIAQGDHGVTEVSLINPNRDPADLKLRLYDAKGQSLATQSFMLAAHERRRAIIPALFPSLSNFSKAGHLRVSSTCPVTGFAVVRTINAAAARSAGPSDLIGFNARPLTEGSRKLYFPYVVTGENFFARLNLVNLSEKPQHVTLTAYRPDGTVYKGPGINNPRLLSIPAAGALRDSAQALFGFPSTTLTTGWLKAEADTGTMAGSLTYGNNLTASLAVVPGQSLPLQSATYPQVSNGAGYFTGLAVINPGEIEANIEVFSLRDDGSAVGIFRKQLKAHEGIARLLHEMVRDAQGQMQGYLFLKADQPVFSSGVLGSRDGRVLVNVPPQPISQTYAPEEGSDVWIDTDLGDQLVWRQRTFSAFGGGRQFVNVIAAATSAYMAPRITGATTTSRAAEREVARAAVNGSFFTFDAELTSVCLVKIDGVQHVDNSANRSVFGILESDYGDRTIVTIPRDTEYTEAYHALGGGPRLIRDGEIFIPYQSEGFSASFANSRHPRTGLGIGLDGTAYMVTADGRGAGDAVGLTLADFAQLLMDLGSFQALNFDGGGSTTMWISDYGVVNRPSDGSERRVSNILAVW
ncbi:MAG: phosphodiester glycosidase family protein [Acidobacteria bacterium]|nr:phosphodiester glycosidase family protein [Acidobacteriota bacterium]MBI3657422.1 phosphodiester glycosidase family protein [Acidobacteriota bacterium]